MLAVSSSGCGISHSNRLETDSSVGLCGLELLLYGPAGFYIDRSSNQLLSRFHKVHWGNRSLPENQFSKRDGIKWIEKYIQYLQYVHSLI